MKNILHKVKSNWKSGITVSLVSIPLSVSLAVASGTTPTVGIITAIAAGLTASIFGGSNFNIVGPTGALSGLIASYALINGAENLAILAIITGIIVLIAYALKLERYLIFIPSSVINGFTLGVALIIAFNQFNHAFAIYGLPKHEKFFDNTIESMKHIQQASLATFLVFSIFLVTLFALKKYLPKIPGALILSPIGIALGYFSTIGAIPLQLATLESIFGEIPFKLFETSNFQLSQGILVTSGAIALVAILETMLSAKIADGMTRTKHNERKEMLGLGLANIASGIAGGIPATAALARTSLNVKTGATDKISATISATFLIIISYIFLGYFKYIPMAVIAAILVYVAVQMIEKELFIKYYHHQKSGFWISMLVAAITFYEDPIIGILFGTALSLLLFVEKLSHGHFDIKLNKFDKGIVKSIWGDTLKTIKENADILLYSFEDKLVYINSRAHISRFEQNLSKFKIVILRLRSVTYIDLDGSEALDEIIDIIQKRKQKVCLTSINENISKLLEETSPGYKKLKEQGLVFNKTQDALRHFGIDPKKD